MKNVTKIVSVVNTPMIAIDLILLTLKILYAETHRKTYGSSVVITAMLASSSKWFEKNNKNMATNALNIIA